MTTYINTATKKAFTNAASADTYIIDSTVGKFTLGGSIGSNGDTFAFDGLASDYSFSFKSNTLTITDPTNSNFKVSIKLAATNGATALLSFVDGNLTATVAKSGSKAATLSIGGQTISSK
ncbi:MAG: hypothetical protein EBY30_15675, partial [Rhodospirillales bacterium]|nr:hypothetical protein [Rhodospirillales bacterium]